MVGFRTNLVTGETLETTEIDAEQTLLNHMIEYCGERGIDEEMMEQISKLAISSFQFTGDSCFHGGTPHIHLDLHVILVIKEEGNKDA